MIASDAKLFNKAKHDPALPTQKISSWISLLVVNGEKVDKKYPTIFTIWKDYFTLGYYLCIVPFKPHLLEDTNRVTLQTSKIQKGDSFLLVWGCAWTINVTDFVAIIVNCFRNGGTPLTAKFYFQLLQQGLGLSVNFLYFFSLVKHQEDIEKYLNDLLQLSSIAPFVQNQRRARRCNIYVVSAYLAYFSMIVLTLPFTGSPHSFQIPQESFRGYIRKARVYLFLNGTAISEPYSATDISLGVVQIFVQFWYHHISWFKTALFIGPLPVTFWLMVKCFQEFCESQKGALGILKDLAGIQDKYEAFKRCVVNINAVWGTATLVWAISSVIAIMMLLNVAFASMYPLNIAIIVIWMTFVGSAFILSGETYRTITSFRGLLLEQKYWDKFYVQDRKTLLRMLKDIDGQLVGIGLVGLYRLRYGFIMQLLVAALTMFLVSFEN